MANYILLFKEILFAKAHGADSSITLWNNSLQFYACFHKRAEMYAAFIVAEPNASW
jgi:hypothetical protein